jgi:hypothetical protein
VVSIEKNTPPPSPTQTKKKFFDEMNRNRGTYIKRNKDDSAGQFVLLIYVAFG